MKSSWRKAGDLIIRGDNSKFISGSDLELAVYFSSELSILF